MNQVLDTAPKQSSNETPLNNDPGYAGDKTPLEAWKMLENVPEAILVDTRTTAEWTYVGVPDLSAIQKKVHMVAWQEFPDMEIRPNFIKRVKKIATDTSTPILFICRSGVRSVSTAQALSAEGYTACYNVLEGFEGDMDENKHRSNLGGWKFHGLPWKQR